MKFRGECPRAAKHRVRPGSADLTSVYIILRGNVTYGRRETAISRL